MKNPNGAIGEMLSQIHKMLARYDEKISLDMELDDVQRCILTKGTLDDDHFCLELVPQVGISADIMKDLIEDLEATFGLEGVFVKGVFYFNYDL